jgi:formylglycine-generating enzyme required for sulfatase activity
MRVLMVAACWVTALVFGAWADTAGISDVVVRQRWPWSRLVDIDYVLDCAPTQRVDVALSAYNDALPLTLDPQSLSGDLYAVAPGARRIVWDPMKSAYTNELFTRFRVDLSATAVPAYLIIDLSKSLGEEGQITYRYDWSGNWTDITNHTEYMTTNLVLRRIPGGTFAMGSPTNEALRATNEDQHNVTLTESYYLGVFEVTQWQWAKLMNDAYPSFFTNLTCREARPVEWLTYDMIRGKTTAAGWPGGGMTTGFMKALCDRTGLTCDLPTEAQWERACRAETTGAYYCTTNAQTGRTSDNNGGTGYSTDTASPWRAYDTTRGTARVGSYRANPWGLYDMYGNVSEWCVDHYNANLGNAAVTDPVFLSGSGNTRVNRNVAYHVPISVGYMRSARRTGQDYNSGYSSLYGFRVMVKNTP